LLLLLYISSIVFPPVCVITTGLCVLLSSSSSRSVADDSAVESGLGVMLLYLHGEPSKRETVGSFGRPGPVSVDTKADPPRSTAPIHTHTHTHTGARAPH
jgi:hypothetical protein